MAKSRSIQHPRVAISYDQGSYGGIDRRGFYVSASRGREDAKIFTDDKDFIRDCLRRNTGERTTATELVGCAPRLVTTKMLRQRQKQIQEQVAGIEKEMEQERETVIERTMNDTPDEKAWVK